MMSARKEHKLCISVVAHSLSSYSSSFYWSCSRQCSYRVTAAGRDSAERSRRPRKLALTFIASFVNFGGLLITLEAFGARELWSEYQFAGLFGLIEIATGLAN